MGLSDLSQIEIIQGSFALLFVSISIFLGLRILYKYFIYKRKELITISLAWIFLSSGWWGVSVNFTLIVLFNIELPVIFEIIVNQVFLPGMIICWIYTFTSLTYPNLRKRLTTIYAIIGLIVEICFIYFIITNPDMIAVKESRFNVRSSLFTLIFVVFMLISALVTGVLFAWKSMQSEDIIIRWKGKIILIAFISICLGAILDAGVSLDATWLIIARLILISSAFEYYIGFLMPEKIKNWILKRR